MERGRCTSVAGSPGSLTKVRQPPDRPNPHRAEGGFSPIPLHPPRDLTRPLTAHPRRESHPSDPPRCPPSAPSARSRTSHASCRPVAASLALAARSTWSYDASLYASTLAQRCVLALHPSACRHAALTALSRRLSRPSRCILTDDRSLASSQGSCARLRESPGMILGSPVRASRAAYDGMRRVARFAGGAECGRLARGRDAVARPYRCRWWVARATSPGACVNIVDSCGCQMQAYIVW